MPKINLEEHEIDLLSELLVQDMNKLAEEISKMDKESEHTYSFVSGFYDVDFERIEREAPEGTPFILVESRERRTKKPNAWALFVHNDVLSHEAIQPKEKTKNGQEGVSGFLLGPEKDVDLLVSPSWGEFDNINGKTLSEYRGISGNGKFPGFIKQQIETIRKAINEKDTVTKVTYA